MKFELTTKTSTQPVKIAHITDKLAFVFEHVTTTTANCHLMGDGKTLKYNHLMELAEAAIATCGIPTLFCVLHEDLRNVRVAASMLGFKKTGDIPNYYGNNKSAYIYTRSVS